MAYDIEKIIGLIEEGTRLGIAKGITVIENDLPEKTVLLSRLSASIGRAKRIGITGPPGAGKSTLVYRMAKHLASIDKTSGIVAVDPSSPFSGGAILGDRIRMNPLFNERKVFIRSMASRGSLGGLALSSEEAADIMDAAGKDYVIYETVGVGQAELEIAKAADTTVVLLVPGSGDSIQAMKSGLMEIADIFVVNKSDRSGADRTLKDLQNILAIKKERDGWKPPVVSTIAESGKGIPELIEAIDKFLVFQEENGMLAAKKKNRFKGRVRRSVNEKCKNLVWNEKREQMIADSDGNDAERLAQAIYNDFISSM